LKKNQRRERRLGGPVEVVGLRVEIWVEQKEKNKGEVRLGLKEKRAGFGEGKREKQREV
jgi:hypothetical protein